MAKSSRSSKKVTSRPKKTSSRSKLSFFKTKFFFVLALAIFTLVGMKMIYRAMVQPSGINEITAGYGKQDAPLKVDANGCYEKQIQCVKAPCNPIMVCPAGVSPAPVATKSPEMCAQEYGNCVNKTGQCVTYTDGCQKSALCISPIKSCDMAKPAPSATPISCTCPPGARCKLDARCNPNPTTKPTPTPRPSPSPLPPSTTSKPTPTTFPSPSIVATPFPSPSAPNCIPKISSLSMKSNSCAGGSFSSATYSCTGGTPTILELSGCVSASTIFTQVRTICGSSCQ